MIRGFYLAVFCVQKISVIYERILTTFSRGMTRQWTTRSDFGGDLNFLWIMKPLRRRLDANTQFFSLSARVHHELTKRAEDRIE